MTLFMFVFIENARWSSQLKSKQIAFNIHLFNFLLLIWSYHATLVLALYFLSYYVHIGPLFLIILCSYWPFISYTMLILALYFYSVWNKILSVDRQLGCLHQIYQGPKEMLMAPSLSDTGNMGPVWGVWFWKIWSKILHSECHLS
jgi:hypothetical protein